MSTAPRIAFFAWALLICPALMVGLIEVVDKVEDDTHAWLLIVGVPALLTTTVGVLGRRSRAEIVLAAFLSAGLRTRITMKPGVAGTRCAARCFVLGRAHMCHMDAPCVLASHSRSAPRPTSVIVIRVLSGLAVLLFILHSFGVLE